MLFEILFDSRYEFPYNFILFTILVVALIFSLTMHEIAHGYAALLNGDPTAKLNKRLSLNPLKHLDPIGFSMLVIAGFGYAKPVPVNPTNFFHQRRGLFLVSIAGVTVNIILAFLSAFFIVIIVKFSPLIQINSAIFYVYLFFLYLMRFNLILCFFNLLPLFPLDGYNVIVSLTKSNNKFTIFLRKYSLYILAVLIALGIIVSQYPVDAPWWDYVDILGTYLNFLAENISSAFLWFWRLIFRI